MSEAKCPLCGGDLIQSKEFPNFYSCQSTNWKSDADKLCELDDCAASVPVWETLHRTRKALDVAVDALKNVQKNSPENYTATQAVFLLAKNSVFVNNALEQITALEQKDVK